MSWRGSKEEHLRVPQAPLWCLLEIFVSWEKKDELKGYSSIFKAGPHVYIFWCVNDWYVTKSSYIRGCPSTLTTAAMHAAMGKQRSPWGQPRLSVSLLKVLCFCAAQSHCCIADLCLKCLCQGQHGLRCIKEVQYTFAHPYNSDWYLWTTYLTCLWYSKKLIFFPMLLVEIYAQSEYLFWLNVSQEELDKLRKKRVKSIQRRK